MGTDILIEGGCGISDFLCRCTDTVYGKKYDGGTRQVCLDPLDEGQHTGADEAREKSRGMMRKREEKGREGESE